ncbi:MAG: cyclopropane fatty acyl phospholipid synthase [Cyanobacteriota bacterium]|nr:cyclopropane fatty acyl phospholipid synthase [Cyanobacteriota bacterium]
MPSVSLPPQLEALLDQADVRLDGRRPWDLRLHRPGVLAEVARRGSLGFGEAYVRGDWDCDALDQLFTRLLRVGADRRLAGGSALGASLAALAARLVDAQSPRRSRRAVRHHYDIHPAVYAAMLDPWRQYSCGYWQGASTLEQAQEAKLALIASKLDLTPGQRVLDIGCGWGGLAAWLADGHGVEVVGITLSPRQRDWARERWAALPVRFELCDYRDLAALAAGPFDRIVSVGMLEHVGPGHLGRFFQELHRALRPDGLALVHTIGYPRRTAATDPWIATHVFPGGRLPAAAVLADALAEDWLIEDWHAFGADYDPTLMAWCERFEAAWPRLQPLLAAAGDGPEGAERFRRHWRYYLLCCAAFFRARQGQLWQLVLSPADGLRPEPYRSIRP